jgi:Na+/H+-dicarboxylate symporter
MSGIGAPVSVLGIILPIYTIIDMIETAENVWSDSCVCAMVERPTPESSNSEIVKSSNRIFFCWNSLEWMVLE